MEHRGRLWASAIKSCVLNLRFCRGLRFRLKRVCLNKKTIVLILVLILDKHFPFFFLSVKKYNPHEDISLSEWRSRYKCDFQQVLQDMHGECANISDKCTSILTQLQSSNGIVCVRKKRSDDARIDYDY